MGTMEPKDFYFLRIFRLCKLHIQNQIIVTAPMQSRHTLFCMVLLKETNKPEAFAHVCFFVFGNKLEYAR
jgi:hypothetical protein